MRKIKIECWKARVPKFDQDGTNIIGTEEQDETLLSALNVLLSNKRPEEIPVGLDKFRLFNRLGKAFEKANKTKVLELEEGDYSFLKTIIEKDVPSTWGMNQKLSKAIEDFLIAKEE